MNYRKIPEYLKKDQNLRGHNLNRLNPTETRINAFQTELRRNQQREETIRQEHEINRRNTERDEYHRMALKIVISLFILCLVIILYVVWFFVKIIKLKLKLKKIEKNYLNQFLRMN
jgi:Flp pilus assembly protein TadB